MIYSLKVKKKNPWLNKSLNKYLSFSFIILLILSFMFNIYLEDTKKYYTNPIKNVLVVEKEKKENENYEDVISNQHKLSNQLTQQGFIITNTDLVFSSSLYLLKNIDDERYNKKNIYLCKNDNYFNYLLQGKVYYDLDDKLKNESNQIIFFNEDREEFDQDNYIAEITMCSNKHNVVLNGEYRLNYEKYLFYQDNLQYYKFDNALCINTSEEVYRDIFSSEETLNYKYIFTFKENIEADDLKVLEKIVENPICSIGDYLDTSNSNEFLINAFERLLIIIVLTSFGITLILLYHYFKDAENIFMINKIFYESKANNFFNVILYPLILILAQFLIPLLVLTILDLIIYLIYGYFVKLFEYYVVVYLLILLLFIIINGLIISNKKIRER